MGMGKQWLVKAIFEQEHAAEWAEHKGKITWITWEWVEKASDEFATMSATTSPSTDTSSELTSLSPSSACTNTPLEAMDLVDAFSSCQS